MPTEQELKAEVDAKAYTAKQAAEQDTAKAELEKREAEKRSLDKYPQELQDHIRELRAENKQRREREEKLAKDLETAHTRNTEYAKAEEARERAALVEEKKFQELADSERKKREESEVKATEKLRSRDKAVIRQELKAHAKDLGIIDPDDIRTIDIRDMRVTDEGEVPGSKEAIEALKAAKPHWFKAETDSKDKSKHPVVTPTRKENPDGRNWGNATPAEITAKAKQYGITV